MVDLQPERSLLVSLAQNHHKLRKRLRGLNPIDTAASIGGLMTEPALQPHGLRLEVLAHFVVANCAGRLKPSYSVLTGLFEDMGQGPCGSLEDPPEDIFVELIRTPRGQFRILPGTFEASSFFVQRVMNVLETMPDTPGHERIRDSCYALLRLSDEVCERAGLVRYEAGGGSKLEHLPHVIAVSARALRARVEFSLEDLDRLGVTVEQLLPFIIDPVIREALFDQDLGATELERRPLILGEGRLVLALPIAVSSAIRRALVESLGCGELREPFARAFAAEYARLFAELKLLGGESVPGLRFQRIPGGLAASIAIGIDEGRYLQYIFLGEDSRASRPPRWPSPTRTVNRRGSLTPFRG